MDINLLAAVFAALRLKEAVVARLSSSLQGAAPHLGYHHPILAYSAISSSDSDFDSDSGKLSSDSGIFWQHVSTHSTHRLHRLHILHRLQRCCIWNHILCNVLMVFPVVSLMVTSLMVLVMFSVVLAMVLVMFSVVLSMMLVVFSVVLSMMTSTSPEVRCSQSESQCGC